MKIPKITIDWGLGRFKQDLEIIKLDKGFIVGRLYFKDKQELLAFIEEFLSKNGLLD